MRTCLTLVADLFSPAAEEIAIKTPFLARHEGAHPQTPDYESPAIYGSEIAKNRASFKILKDASAAVRCNYGAGRAFYFSLHPEITGELHDLIPTVVHWLADETTK